MQKVMLITGASSGIGMETARAAAAEGYRLILAARSVDKLESLASELGGPEQVLPIACDVTELNDQEQMVARGLEAFGRIDVVFANAGIGGRPGGFTGADPEYWKQLILTNVYGCALTIRVCADALKSARGHLILTGSNAGRRTIPGSMYSTTKWAVTSMGYSAREEFAGTGVRVTLLEPGMVDTPFFDDPKPDALKSEDVARSVIYAISQPEHVNVHELLILPNPPVE